MGKTLILEGTNAIGKDVIIDKFLEYCPYYKVHYASSSIAKFAKDNINILPDLSYATFETIYHSIKKDISPYQHIQYRSYLSNLVYNSLFRPENIDITKKDEKYLEEFFNDKYDKDFTLWIMCYYKEYLLNLTEEAKEKRLKSRTVEINKIIEINDKYEEFYNKLLERKYPINIQFTKCIGSLDLVYKIDTQIDKAYVYFKRLDNDIVRNVYIINMDDQEYRERAFNSPYYNDNVIMLTDNAEKIKSYLNNESIEKRFGNRYFIIENPNKYILPRDFFIIYSTVNIFNRIKYDNFEFGINKEYFTYITSKLKKNIIKM